MQSDNDLSTARVDLAIDAAENQEDRTVEWLLEQDYTDPAEKLFTVADEDVVENAGLTEYEAEIANRPMFGGEGTSDDLSCFVSEEIVLSETGSTDIFGGSESPNAASGSESAVPLGFSMAVDRSGASQVDRDSEANSIEEGFDILGLDEEDDIGERHVVMQKNPAKKRKKTLRAVTTANAPVEKTEVAVSSDATEQAESELAIDIDINQPVSVDLVTTDLGASDLSALETEDTEPEISLELPEVELSNEETELEIQNLPTLDAIETEEETELPVSEFDGFLSDSSGFLSQPEDTEVQEISADTEEQPLESIMDDISELQLNLDDELQALDVPTEELVTTSEDESAGFLGAQAMSLALVDDVDNEEQLAVEPMSFDMEPVTLDTAVDEITEAPAVELTEEPVEIALDNNVDLLAELESPELVVFDAVADLEEAPAEDTIELVDNASSEDFGVLDYVAANEPPVDDAEFDQYLLGGEHLEDPDLSLEGLVVDSTEGVVSVDPQLETAIDYHEDFNTEEVLNNDFVTAITGVIADVMEELTVCVDERLRKLSLAPDSVQVEVMLGTDEASMKQCQEENYQPILGLATSKLETLSTLGQAEIDSIYVRLSNIYDDSDWNQLFAEDFVAPSTDIDSESAETPAAFSDKDDFLGGDLSFTDSLAPSEDLSSDKLPEFDQELSAENVFDEEALSEDILAETASPFDIEDDLENSTGQLLDKAQEDSLSQPDASLDDLSFANFDGKDDSVFGEDIFAGDLSEEFAPVDVSAGVDVEALIHSLADAETDIGEICGVSVDQFANTDAANSEDTAKTPDVAVPVPAAEVANSTDGELSWCVPADIQFSHTNQPSTEIFSEFLDAFIEEGASELEKLEDALGEWEKDISNEPAYLPIPRILHTLKGIAKGVGLQRYGTLIHNFETLLDSLDRPEVGQQAAYFRIVNGWLDASAKGFEHIEQERTDITSELPTHSSAPVLDKVKPAVAEEVAPVLPVSVQTLSEDSPVVAIADSVDDSHKDKQLADEGAKVLAAQQTIRMTPEALDRLLSLTNEAQQLGVRSSQATVRSKRSAAELLTRLSSVRAHVSKIAERTLLNVTAKGGQAASTMDALEMDQYSELQEAANFLREGVEDLDDLIHLSSRQNTVAEALLKQQASIISSLGSSIQAARVIPVSRLMPGLRRIVRTVSADLGKSVSFRVLNEVGTLDRDNHARCQIILEHMTRNALDHGIETPEVRAAAGKDTTGSITIEASKLGSDYIVTLSDDGKGIDPEFMRDMAYEKGLDIDVDKLTDEEAIRLIFHKGFSTATVVSEISGRGVGMDIVLSELQHIGGDIEIESTVGVGTTFKVRIPSNVTVNGALLVAAGEVSYAVPLDGLIAVEHVPVDVFYDAIRDNSQLTLFGMDCDPAYLATICHGDSLPDRSSWNTTVPVIIAGSESRYMAIAIDDVTQALELVIRSLGAQFSMIPGLAGGATTADGKSIVALDLNALVESSPTDELSPVSMRTEREERMLVLVVDDSRTQRMVATSQFDNLGVETVTAENGLVAIDLLNTTHRLPDVILLDIEMPVKDGIQTLREIRKSTRYSDLPVIMVTSRTGAKHRALAEDAGCNGYMGKPFNFPKLVEQIADLTNHKFQLS